MEFEKAYQKFLNGTASPEEIEFVRSEMKKANEVSEVLSGVKREQITEVAQRQTVRSAMKRFLKKDTLKILLIVCCAIVAVSIAVACIIGIPILSSASENLNYTEDEARQIAVLYLTERHPERAEKIKVHRVERELEVEGRIKKARYIYVVDIYNGFDDVVEIEIDAKTGNIVDVD